MSLEKSRAWFIKDVIMMRILKIALSHFIALITSIVLFFTKCVSLTMSVLK